MSATTNTAASTTASCRTAMDNLGIFLKSYATATTTTISISMSDQQKLLESLFDKTFDRKIRLDLNGYSYKRDFLIYQETRNFARRLRVDNIVMEVLDNETFHYTYEIYDWCYDDDRSCSSSHAATATSASTFHSLATVKNGKIVKIKPMTGSAYVGLFEFNINYVMEKAEVPSTTTTTTLSTIKTTTITTPSMLTATNNIHRKRSPPTGEESCQLRRTISGRCLIHIHRVSGLLLSRRGGNNSNSSKALIATTERMNESNQSSQPSTLITIAS